MTVVPSLTAFGRRAFAAAVDLALATGLAALVSVLVSDILRGPPLSWLMTDDNFVRLFGVSIGCACSTVVFAYLWHRSTRTPGLAIAGLTIREFRTGNALSAQAAFARWVLLYAPITLWMYPLVISTVFDPREFLVLIEFPAWLYQQMLLPVGWYVLLGVSVVLSDDGRGWHDRFCGSVVRRSTVVERRATRPAGRLVWGVIVVALVALVIAAGALDDVVVGCDYGPIGIGRPDCVTQLSTSYVTLTGSLAVLSGAAISIVSAFFRSIRGDHRWRQ